MPEQQQINLDAWVSLIGRQTLQIDQLIQENAMLKQQLAEKDKEKPIE